nr:hypothetical protein [Corynebacterium belfantii]
MLVTDIDVQTGIIPVTAKASCATTNAKPYATIKATPQEGIKVTALHRGNTTKHYRRHRHRTQHHYRKRIILSG